MLKRIALVLAALFLTVPAHAGSWPEKPIQVVVPWSPGGSSDISARIVGDKIQK